MAFSEHHREVCVHYQEDLQKGFFIRPMGDCQACCIVSSTVVLYFMDIKVRNNLCCFHMVLAPHALFSAELASRGRQAARRELKTQLVCQDP